MNPTASPDEHDEQLRFLERAEHDLCAPPVTRRRPGTTIAMADGSPYNELGEQIFNPCTEYNSSLAPQRSHGDNALETEILCTVCKAKNRVDSERLQAARCGKCKASLSSPLKKCKFCAEYIKDEALKCKHCGEFVSDSDRQRIEAARLRQAGSGVSGFSSFFEHLFGGKTSGDTHLEHLEKCPSCHGSGLTQNGICPGCGGRGTK